MLIIRNLNLISVQSWTYLNTIAKFKGKLQTHFLLGVVPEVRVVIA